MEHDSAENPLVYSQDREIEFETTELRFSYQINLSTLNEIHNVYSIIHKLCGTTTFFKSFHDALFDDTDWKKLSNQNYPTKNLIHWQTDTINQLKVEWNTYVAKNGSTSKCDHLQYLTEQLIGMNDDFRKVIKFKSAIPKIVPMEILQTDAYNFTTQTNLTSAFDYSHWLVEHFFKYTKYEFIADENTAYLTIIIPLYSHANLFKVYRKPVLYDHVPYILNSDANYLIENQIGLNYFSNIDEICFSANAKFFCAQPKVKNECDDYYIAKTSKNFIEHCFTRLPFKNVVTQIQDNLYFLNIEPFSVDIRCNNSVQSIQIFQPSKIEANRCVVNSTFFTIDPNSVQEYGIYFSNSTSSNKETTRIVQIGCFLAFVSLYMLIVNAMILYYYRLNIQNNAQIYLETMV